MSAQSGRHPVVLPDEDDVHAGEEGMLVHTIVSRHEVLLGLGAEQLPVRSQVELLSGWQLVG